MEKVDLFSTEAFVKEDKVRIKITLANAAKWSPTEIDTYEMSIEEYLDFLEKGLEHLVDETVEIKSGVLRVEFLKTITKLIFNDVYTFTMKKKDLEGFIHSELEKLYIQDF
tara:strand:+ start:3387 stop:3719 length:333 start_codon:yes stop_codon:yes gene_type:complete